MDDTQAQTQRMDQMTLDDMPTRPLSADVAAAPQPPALAVVYTFAGITMAGENVMECQACGCLVRMSMEHRHTTFHGRV